MTRNFCIKAAILLISTIVPGMINAAGAEPLTIVPVHAPDVYCNFAISCKVDAKDAIAGFAWSSLANDSLLQSRTWFVGQPGTVAAGLYAYLYRIDLSKAATAVPYVCVAAFSIPFGPVESVDYDGNGTPGHVFVVADGSLGAIAPVTANRNGNNIDFTFQQPFCNGGTTFFFGMSSKHSPRYVITTLSRDIEPALNLKAFAPQMPVWKKGTRQEMNREIRTRY
jgi:hypothetical protein